ncbi:hypothetical protein [Kocuria sp. HSID16901]|uniref:hypothetical protein n=1 Tax=Kocuria sp. HSID16901 TaxID=2419505 RepID=UPI000F88C7D8|nr:hypothetical protein [Kocuria sp. HSID16901]RUQ19584.1 hypothetical protein D8M21_11250 [Kocuria sp. HSID16901]
MSGSVVIASIVSAGVALFKEARLISRTWMLVCSICAILLLSSHTKGSGFSPLARLKEIVDWFGADTGWLDTASSWLHEPAHADVIGNCCWLLLILLVIAAMFSPSELPGFSAYPILALGAEVSNLQSELALWLLSLAALAAYIVLLVVLEKAGDWAYDHGIIELDAVGNMHMAYLRLSRCLFSFVFCPLYVIALPVMLMAGL